MKPRNSMFKLTLNKVASAGLALLAAAAYAMNAGHYIPGCVAAIVGIIAIAPAALRFVDDKRYGQRQRKMGR